MKKCAILSTSRADFNYLYPPYQALLSAGFECEFWATGQHFSQKHGNIIQEYRKIIPNIFEIPFAIQDSMALGISLATKAMHDFLSTHQHPDFVIVLGDRYEVLGACLAINDAQIPIVHLAGGDISLGAKDDIYRFCISKLAQFHCPTNKYSARNLRKIGINSKNICNIGSTSFDYIATIPKISRDEFYENLGIQDNRDFILITLHSETINPNSSAEQAHILRETLESYPQYLKICTGANMDTGGQAITKIMNKQNKNWLFRENLGASAYIQAMFNAKICMGNSSSGIYEAAFCHTPAINIGIRQLGRLAPPSVLHCDFNMPSIKNAITQAENLDKELFLQNPYGKGNAVKKLIKFIIKNA